MKEIVLSELEQKGRNFDLGRKLKTIIAVIAISIVSGIVSQYIIDRTIGRFENIYDAIAFNNDFAREDIIDIIYGETIGDPSIGLSSPEINNLKVLNDWGLALDLSKSRSYVFDSYSSEYSWVTAQELIDGAMNAYEERAVDIRLFDHNQGKHLWLIRASTKDKPKFEDTVYYFAIITKEGEKESISKLLALDDLYAYQTALHEFKLENGWSFSNAQFNEG